VTTTMMRVVDDDALRFRYDDVCEPTLQRFWTRTLPMGTTRYFRAVPMSNSNGPITKRQRSHYNHYNAVVLSATMTL